VDGVGSVGTGTTAGPYQYSSPPNIRDPRQGMTYDMRARMKDYWALNQLAGCPFSKAVDLSRNGSVNTTMITADYNIFFGWRYTGSTSNDVNVGGVTEGQRGWRPGMFKLGDRFSYRDPSSSGDRYYDVLVGDVDSYDTGNTLTWASHPDNLSLGEMVWQNFGDPASDPQASTVAYGAVIGDPSFAWTWSRWDCRAGVGLTWYRAPLDDNFAFADGSAQRYSQVSIDQTTKEPDDRMSRASFYAGGGTRIILPKR
jgi:hypothetical protein